MEVPLLIDATLDGWTVGESGGSESGSGSVTAQNGEATLIEGDSFLVTLSHSFQVEPGETAVSFTYEATFDGGDPNFVKDAFEVALLDADGNPLVGTISPGRDSYFNDTEGLLSPALGENSLVDGQTVSVDLAGVPTGSTATLIFRLINNDSDTNSSVRLTLDRRDEPPTATVGLANDTAPSGPGAERYGTDLLTNDATLQGTAVDDLGIALLQAQFDGGAFQDITSTLVADQYVFDPGPLPAGPHHVLVRATDTGGQSDDAEFDFAVNQPPTANAGGDRTVPVGTTVTFDGTGSSDNEGPLFSYRWTFDDGSVVDGPTASHRYAHGGTFPVILVVTDTAGSQVTDTIQVAVQDVPRFLTVDTSADKTFRYDDGGSLVSSTSLSRYDTEPRGIVTNAAGDTTWVIDCDRTVYVYNAAGEKVGAWTARNLVQPQDITTDGTDIWILDSACDRVYRYAGAAAHTSGSQAPAASFALDCNNQHPTGIVTDGTTFWVTDDRSQNIPWVFSLFTSHHDSTCDAVFVYSATGRTLGSWQLDARNSQPTGITLDPEDGADLWVVDEQDSTVYHYVGATSRRSGQQSASDSFALTAANHHAEGIAALVAHRHQSQADGPRRRRPHCHGADHRHV